MRRGAVALAAASAAALVLAVPASAAPRETSLTVRARGALSVEFRGDPAAGCEEHGNCGYSGTITWTPPRDGLLFVDESGRGGRRVDAGLLLGLGEESKPVAQVRRETPSGAREVCADVADLGANFIPLRVRDRRVEFGLDGTDLVRTRCAGPLQADLAPFVPARVLGVSALRRGDRTVDLSGEHTFAAGGFSGTVASSLRFELRDPEEGSGFGRGGTRVRELTARYDVELTGQERLTFAGLGDPLCAPLDACGVTGSVVLTPAATRGQLVLVATARASRPRRDLRAALGLSSRGRRGDVDAYGYGGWRSDSGLAVAAVERADGSPTCRDSVPVRRGGLAAYPSGSSMELLYGDGFEFGLSGDPLRTRCPGPLGADLGRFAALARGEVPLSAFGSRSVVVRLDDRRGFRREGYRGTAAPDLRLELRRRSVRERIYRAPFF